MQSLCESRALPWGVNTLYFKQVKWGSRGGDLVTNNPPEVDFCDPGSVCNFLKENWLRDLRLSSPLSATNIKPRYDVSGSMFVVPRRGILILIGSIHLLVKIFAKLNFKLKSFSSPLRKVSQTFLSTQTKNRLRSFCLCRGEDLNLQGITRLLLRQVRLPISPPRHICIYLRDYTIIFFIVGKRFFKIKTVSTTEHYLSLVNKNTEPKPCIFVMCPGRGSNITCSVHLLVKIFIKLNFKHHKSTSVLINQNKSLKSFSTPHAKAFPKLSSIAKEPMLLLVLSILILLLCPGRGSNPHPVRDTILSRACIPIPPPGRYFVKLKMQGIFWRRRPGLNRRITVLQTVALTNFATTPLFIKNPYIYITKITFFLSIFILGNYFLDSSSILFAVINSKSEKWKYPHRNFCFQILSQVPSFSAQKINDNFLLVFW